MMPNIHSVRINPLRAASAVFLMVSPFLTWVTIVSVVLYKGAAIFGSAAQSDLLMVSSRQLGTNITPSAALSAGVAIIAFLVGGILMFRSVRLGAAVSLGGLLAFLVPFYPLFGLTYYGIEFTFISPGIGFFTAATGLILGLASSKVASRPPRDLFHALRTSKGLSALGASIGALGLSLDVLNHYVLGQIGEFISAGPVDEILRLGLIAAVASIFVIVLAGGPLMKKPLLVLSLGSLGLLGFDLLNSFSTGDLSEFLGHNLTETILHLAVYYGVALTSVGSLVGLVGDRQ